MAVTMEPKPVNSGLLDYVASQQLVASDCFDVLIFSFLFSRCHFLSLFSSEQKFAGSKY